MNKQLTYHSDASTDKARKHQVWADAQFRWAVISSQVLSQSFFVILFGACLRYLCLVKTDEASVPLMFGLFVSGAWIVALWCMRIGSVEGDALNADELIEISQLSKNNPEVAAWVGQSARDGKTLRTRDLIEARETAQRSMDARLIELDQKQRTELIATLQLLK